MLASVAGLRPICFTRGAIGARGESVHQAFHQGFPSEVASALNEEQVKGEEVPSSPAVAASVYGASRNRDNRLTQL